jgi:hypothetical protein
VVLLRGGWYLGRPASKTKRPPIRIQYLRVSFNVCYVEALVPSTRTGTSYWPNLTNHVAHVENCTKNLAKFGQLIILRLSAPP